MSSQTKTQSPENTAEPKCSVSVGFIGAGKMATALAQGLIQSGFCSAGNVTASDVYPGACKAFADACGSKTCDANHNLISRSQIVFLSVKPQTMASLLSEIAPSLTADHLVVSIAAGVTLATIEAALPGIRVIRVMPNTPALVGEGASGFSRGRLATAEDSGLVKAMLDTVGLALEVPESQLDAVTGLSGSGPAYVFEIIEALSDGGVLMGLPRSTATQLAAQTLLGAAKMVLATGEHPGQLKDAVTSPAGTTIAGLLALEQNALRGALMQAVKAATERSRELSKT